MIIGASQVIPVSGQCATNHSEVFFRECFFRRGERLAESSGNSVRASVGFGPAG